MRQRKVWLLIFSLLVCVCISILVVASINLCDKMNIPPMVMTYPNSSLVKQTLDGVDTSRVPRATYYYTTTDSPEDVIAFYAKSLTCDASGRLNGRQFCRGKSESSTNYFVYIDLGADATSHTTSYIVEIEWSGCSNRLD